MKTSMHIFRLIQGIALFTLATACASAAVNVYITGNATVASAAACDIVLGDDGATMDSDGNIDGSALLAPGKTYQLTINASGITNATINLRPVGNYDVFVNGSATRQIQVYNSAPSQVITDVYDVEIRAATGGTPPGSDTGVAIGSEIAWGVGLGRLYNGAPAGNLVIRSTALDDTVFDRRLLSYSGVNQQVSVMVDMDGKLTQVLAPETFVTVTDNDETGGFDIAFFPIAAVGQRHPSGLFDLNPGVGPYIIYSIAPNLDSNADFKFIVTKQTGSNVLTTAAAYGAGTWMKDMGGQISIEKRTPVDDVPSGQRAELIIIMDGNGNIAKKTKRIYQTFSWNTPDTQPDELIQEIQDPGGAARTTTYDYYTDASIQGSYGRLKSITYADGDWVKYDYYTDPRMLSGNTRRTGMVHHEYHPWLDTPASPPPDGAGTGSGRVIEYDYTTDWDGTKTIVSSRIETINGTTVGQMTATATVNQTFNNLKTWTYTQTQYASATETLATVTKAYQPNQDDANALFNGLTISVENPDGTKVSYARQRGTYINGIFTASSDGAALREVEVRGVTNPAGLASIDGAPLDPVGVIANRSIAITRIRQNGRLMEENTRIYNGSSFEETAWTIYDYDATGRLTHRENSDGTVYTATYDGDFRTSETTETGIHQTYLPDALLRVASVTKIGVGAHTDGYTAQSDLHTDYTYDAAGRVVAQYRHDGGSNIMRETTTYNLSGQTTAHTNVDGYTSTTSESFTAAGGLRRTVHPACGGTVISDYHRDGQPSTISGDATIGQRYIYDVNPSTGFITTTLYNGPDSVVGAYTKETRDWLGRVVSTSTPGPNGNTLVSENFYNNHGQLCKTTRPGLAPIIYEYDNMGALIQSGAAISNPSETTLAPASTDRITAQTSAFTKIDGSWWWETTTKAPLTNNNGTLTTLSTTRTRLNGFTAGKVAETQTIDANNNLATSYTQVDAANKTTYQVTQTPVSTNSAESVYYNGLLVEEIGSAGETMRYAYDSLGRLSLTIPQKTAKVRTFYNTYNAAGGSFTTTQISQTQFEPSNGAPGTLIAQYAYDTAGRVICVTDAYGTTTRNAYNCLGQLMHRWGSATQPVSYTYDNLGRLKTQSTYRDPTINWDADNWPASGAADTTTFDYYYDLPLALARTDAASKTTTWEYDDNARLTRATNARGQPINYTYDPATGELLTKTAPLPGSASVATTTLAYNRAGQLSTVTDALGTRAFTYGGASGLDLLSETLPNYYDAGSSIHRQLTYGYETTGVPGRLNHVTLGTPTTPDLAYTYAYTAVGRIASITATPAGQTQRTFAYDYAPDAPWLMTGMHHATNLETLRRTIAYDEKFGVIKTIDTTWNNGTDTLSQARYDYTYDNRGLRDTAKQSGALYADYGAPTYYHYDYNLRGELLSARQYLGDDVNAQNTPLPGRQYGYAYDAMGNRLSARRTTMPDPALDEHYETNNLNQIVSKENKSTPLSGTALESANACAVGPGIATNGAYQGRFWNIEMLLPNDTAPAKTDLALYFGKHDAAPNLSDAFTKQQRAAFQRQHTEPHDYDADGNLTADGLWLYTYDAENRLVAMETHALLDTLLSAVVGEPQPRKLVFTYDYLGRRVGKTVYKKQSGQWLPEKTLKFAYDGWNLIAEYDALTSDLCPLSTSYVWGLDGAGSLTATAGVGALLMIQNGSDAYFPAYDGNGNIAGLLDKDGNPAAKYEYSPYGEPTRVEGPYAHDNPFRWSTKYTDAETGLVYYGLRYYSPRIGRFINRDPIAEQGGLNLYAMVGNNPANAVDVLGLACSTFSWETTTWECTSERCTLTLHRHHTTLCDDGSSNLGYVNASTEDSGGGIGNATSQGGKGKDDDIVQMEKMVVTAKRKKVSLDWLKSLCATAAGKALVGQLANGDYNVYTADRNAIGGFGGTPKVNGVYTNDIFIANSIDPTMISYFQRAYKFTGDQTNFQLVTMFHEIGHITNSKSPTPRVGNDDEAFARQYGDRFARSVGISPLYPGFNDNFADYQGVVQYDLNKNKSGSSSTPTQYKGPSMGTSAFDKLKDSSTMLTGWDCSRLNP